MLLFYRLTYLLAGLLLRSMEEISVDNTTAPMMIEYNSLEIMPVLYPNIAITTPRTKFEFDIVATYFANFGATPLHIP